MNEFFFIHKADGTNRRFINPPRGVRICQYAIWINCDISNVRYYVKRSYIDVYENLYLRFIILL